MKNLLSFLLLTAMFAGVVACQLDSQPASKDSSSASVDRKNFLEPVKIEITPEIKKDPELEALVKELEVSVNEMSDGLETIFAENKDFIEKISKKKQEDIGMREGLKLMQILTSVGKKSVAIGTVTEKLNSYIQTHQEQGNITDEQIEAIQNVSAVIQKRMEELKDKYSGILDKLQEE